MRVIPVQEAASWEECMTTAPTIRSIRARPVQVPFKRPPLSASGALPSAALVLVDLETREGLTGRSYLFACAPWTLAPLVGCVNAMAEMLAGERRRAVLRPSLR